VVVGIVALAFLLMGFVGQAKKDASAAPTIEKRIAALEAQISELKAELRGSRRLQPANEGSRNLQVAKGNEKGSISEGPGPGPQPLVWTEGQRAWTEDGTNMWTAIPYKVGINTILAPAFDLDINGDLCVRNGINDGASFGSASDVLVSDGAGGVQWGTTPGGANGYIWNQYAAPQSPASWWIDGKGKAVNATASDTALIGIETATGRGVLGQSSPAAGSGVGVTGIGGFMGVVGWIQSNSTVAGALGYYDNIGVFGQSNVSGGAGVFALGFGAEGVYGETNSSTNFGVYGYNAAIGGDGVFGIGNAPLAASYWGGAGVSGSSDDVGIFAHGSAATSHGLVAVGNGVGAWTMGGGAGAAITSSNIGVYARGDDTADSWGIYARSSGSNGVGAFGVSNSNPSCALVGVSAGAGWHTITGEDCGLTANGLWCGGMGWGDDVGTGRGLVGIGDATNLPLGIVTASGSGVCGFSSDHTGVFGCSDNNVGLWGYTYSTTYACIQGGSSSLNTSGLLAVCNTGYRAVETIGGDNLTVGEYSMGVFNTPIQNGDYNGLYVGANVVAWGYWTHLKSSKGKDISTAAVLSPDANVVLSGTSELRDGRGAVTFDETFKELISSDIPVNVIATPTEECKGVYVSDVSKNGFNVNELMSGKSTASFNWIAIGRRKGCEERRVYAEKVLKSKIASKETTVRAAATVNTVTKKENEVKEFKVKKVTPRGKKAINLEKESLKDKEPLNKDMSK